jgi:hypothetical protein
LNEYDATLKLLFQGSATGALRELIGVAVERWLNVELPRVQTPRVDLLGETHEGELVHVEFQSSNDSAMAQSNGRILLGDLSTVGSLSAANPHLRWRRALEDDW